jgi:hypothetical protein
MQITWPGARPDRLLRLLPDEIPHLTGARLLAFRLLWLAALAGAAAVQAMAAWHAQQGVAVTTLGLAQGAVLVAVAALLFRRRPSDPVAAMLSLAFLLWAITGAADGDDGPLTEALDRLRFLLLVAAVLLFPSGRFEPKWTAPVLAAAFVTFLVGLAGTAGLLPPELFLPPAVLCVAAAILSLAVRLYRTPCEIQRQQRKWVAFGLSAGLALILPYRIGVGAAATAPAARFLLETAFRTGVMLMALGFLVSLLRYRLYDAETAISRSAAYVALTLSLLAVFAASEATIELLGQRYLGGRVGDFSGGMAAAIAAVLIAPLHQRVSRWAERRFQRDLVVLREELPERLADLREEADLAGLAAIVLPRLEAGVHASRIALVLEGRVVAAHDISEPEAQAWVDRRPDADGDVAFDRDAEDPLFPLRLPLRRPDEEPFGWVLLGPRPDGSFFRGDELEALEAVSVPLRRAIVAVREREQRLAETNDLFTSLALLASRVAELEQGAAPECESCIEPIPNGKCHPAPVPGEK